MTASDDRFLDVINFRAAREQFERITTLPPNCPESDELIRYFIFDLHAAIEIELRRILYHTFQPQLFITGDDPQDDRVRRDLARMIGGLSFVEMHRMLRPILMSWPGNDFEAMEDIDDVRSQVAYAGDVNDVVYKNRNPFRQRECLAQLYFDVWGMKQCFSQHFEAKIERPKVVLQRYIDRMGVDPS